MLGKEPSSNAVEGHRAQSDTLDDAIVLGKTIGVEVDLIEDLNCPWIQETQFGLIGMSTDSPGERNQQSFRDTGQLNFDLALVHS